MGACTCTPLRGLAIWPLGGQAFHFGVCLRVEALEVQLGSEERHQEKQQRAHHRSCEHCQRHLWGGSDRGLHGAQAMEVKALSWWRSKRRGHCQGVNAHAFVVAGCSNGGQ